jgi:hypothetical protein
VNAVELRGLMLEKYYQRRKERLIGLVPSDFDGKLSEHEIQNIAGQLADHGLIHWRPNPGLGGAGSGMGAITAAGIDAVEGRVPAPIDIRFSLDRSRPPAAPARQSIGVAMDQLARAIDTSGASAADKRTAASLLHAFRQHPLLRIIAQGDAGPAADSASDPDPDPDPDPDAVDAATGDSR